MQFDISSLRKEIESFHKSQKDHFYLKKIVENLHYYGTGDEGVELFRSTCSLAYQMYGIGETWQAVLLVSFACEQAEASKEYADDSDYEKGHWGYE